MPSTRFILSHILDWLVIVALFAAGGSLNFVTPFKRPFSLLDLSISYPYISETVSTTTLVLVSLVAPGIIVVLVVLIFVPGYAYNRSASRSQIIRLKLWELEKGLAGLGLATGLAFFIGQGLKQLIGKPRPDCISRCQPDLNNIGAHVVGGYGQQIDPRWTLVAATICMNPDKSVVDEGFCSFPSGHSTFSWSGLLYLSLFICAKFSIWTPNLPQMQTYTTNTHAPSSAAPPRSDIELLPLASDAPTANTQTSRPDSKDASTLLPMRNSAASPPNYLLIVALIPIATALYICTTRYAYFWHQGFDIISGAVIGILTAVWSFRWYHLPLSRGHGWAWGPRHASRAFGIGVGTDGYVERSAV